MTRSGASSPSAHASQNDLPSKTTDSRHSSRSRGSKPRSGPRRPRTRTFAPMTTSSQRPISLEATLCEIAPVPFDTLGLDKRLLEGVRDLGYKETRPIQSAVIPLALGGNDLISCAGTDTRKTAAFVLATLQKLLVSAPSARADQTPGPDPVQNLPRSRGLV